MTTFIARHGGRTANPSAALGAGIQRLAHGFVSLGVIVRDAVRATRALNDAHTPPTAVPSPPASPRTRRAATTARPRKQPGSRITAPVVVPAVAGTAPGAFSFPGSPRGRVHRRPRNEPGRAKNGSDSGPGCDDARRDGVRAP